MQPQLSLHRCHQGHHFQKTGLHNCNEDTVWQGELLLQEVRHEQEATLEETAGAQGWVCEPGNFGGKNHKKSPQKNPNST